jgi:pyridoxal phosphate enzyme (YggS family)
VIFTKQDIEQYQFHLSAVQDRINKAAITSGRDPKEIQLIAVSKTHPIEAVKVFYKLGQRHFGENKVQEMASKWEIFPVEDIQWHMIGALQTNKLKYLAKRANWIHSISKPEQLKELQKRLTTENRKMNILFQVNISNEDQKSGCEPEQLDSLFSYMENCPSIIVRGLMGIGSLEAEAEDNRPQFRLLRTLLDEYKSKWKSESINLTELSMGMTSDLEVAIEEGSTMIRVGTALFGHRDYSI